MSLISPTTLFVAGSISITLSPAALVWTMRTVAACKVRPAAATRAASTEHLVFIAQHSKLPGLVGDPLFAFRAPGRGAAALDARLHGVQNESAAAPRGEAAWTRALRHVSLDRN